MCFGWWRIAGRRGGINGVKSSTYKANVLDTENRLITFVQASPPRNSGLGRMGIGGGEGTVEGSPAVGYATDETDYFRLPTTRPKLFPPARTDKKFAKSSRTLERGRVNAAPTPNP